MVGIWPSLTAGEVAPGGIPASKSRANAEQAEIVLTSDLRTSVAVPREIPPDLDYFEVPRLDADRFESWYHVAGATYVVCDSDTTVDSFCSTEFADVVREFDLGSRTVRVARHKSGLLNGEKSDLARFWEHVEFSRGDPPGWLEGLGSQDKLEM
ncbi:hypothetical protein Xcel_1599 [Xylanimonas cellulosilytica DSM 15894]|uniref:Uncharacterized protein n=2 Tax=Xylanimonas TaxID=186188 RepID=D1BSD3_XYLCX|nr:hypothetical protein Xcel_1599 [Xylanimonas cellulosilytica DSM 15894]